MQTNNYWMLLSGVSAVLLAPAAQARPAASVSPSPIAPAPAKDIFSTAPALDPIQAIAPEAISPPARLLDWGIQPSPAAIVRPDRALPLRPQGGQNPATGAVAIAPVPTETLPPVDEESISPESVSLEAAVLEAAAPERSPVEPSAPESGFVESISLEPAALERSPTDIAQAEFLPIASPLATAPLPLEGMEDAMAQVTSVAQLADVQPTDWAYQALQSLVERYGGVAGYPDGTFRGDRPLTRYEFAAGLNAAVDALTLQLAIATDGGIATQDDLATWQRLQAEFGAELATLRGRVETLETRVDHLEAQRVSPLLRLNGEVILGLSGAEGGDPPGTGDANVVLTHLTQLQFSGSITGRDAFRIGLSAGNFADLGFAHADRLNTRMALLGFQEDTDDALELSSLEYRFAVGDRLVITLKPVGFSLTTVLSPNALFSSSSDGALSRFAAFNPVFRIGALDSGVGADWLISDRARLQVAYGTRNAGDGGQGFFAADQRVLGVQLLARPLDTVTTGIAYVNGFDANGFLNTFTGSHNADTSGGFNEPATIHAISGTLQWQITPTVVFGAWGGIIGTDSLPTDAAALSTTYQFSLGVLDPFSREGDLLGVIVGQPPRLRIGHLIEREDEGASMHYEAFYRFRVNDYLDITPGLFIVTDPGHIAENNTIVVGAIRSTLRF